MSKQRKPLTWLHGEVKTPPFSAEARIEAGVLLRHLQEGINISLPHSRPMPGGLKYEVQHTLGGNVLRWERPTNI